MKKKLLYGSLILMLILTAAQRIPSDIWWIRISDFPHIQLTVLTAILLIAVLLWTDWGFWLTKVLAGLGIIAIIYQIYIIYPYTIIPEPQVEGTEECANASVSILEANVLQKNRDYGQFIEMVESYSPDLVVALETDQGWADTLINSLSDYEYVQSEPLDNTYGMLLLSRIPFVKSETKYRVKDDIPSFDIDIELGGREVSIYVVHPRPPSPSESDSTTQRDAELVMVGREADKNPNPVIVVGDMNDVAWSHTTRLFQRLSGLLDPRKGTRFFQYVRCEQCSFALSPGPLLSHRRFYGPSNRTWKRY